MIVRARRRRIVGATVGLVVAVLGLLLLGPTAGAQDKPSKEALRELRVGAKLLTSKRGRDRDIATLRGLIEKHPLEPAAKKAREILRQNGIGDIIRVRLIDKKVFKRFGYSEEQLLELGEKVLKTLEDYFKKLEPYYRERSLDLVFYDSQARYRKETGNIHYGGHFEVRQAKDKERSLEGEVVWYLPQQAGTPKDRLTTITSTLYHETAHFLSAIHFARTVPHPIEEGLAKFFESRHSTEYYQAYRATPRQYTESSARNGLNAIAKYDDFVAFLGAERGFGQAGRMLDRWYGICYALVDFVDRGEIDGRKASINDLLAKFGERTKALKKDRASRSQRAQLSCFVLMTGLARDLYGADLKKLHAALVEFMLKEYKRL